MPAKSNLIIKKWNTVRHSRTKEGIIAQILHYKVSGVLLL